MPGRGLRRADLVTRERYLEDALPVAVGAAEALSMGLVNQVVAPEAVYDTARELAERLARGPALAQRAAKEAIDHVRAAPRSASCAWTCALHSPGDSSAARSDPPDASPGASSRATTRAKMPMVSVRPRPTNSHRRSWPAAAGLRMEACR